MDVTAGLTVEIDELDLTAVPAARRYQVAATFERELRRLLDAQPPDRDRLHRLEADGAPALTIGVDLGANPVLVGAALAAAVFEALRR